MASFVSCKILPTSSLVACRSLLTKKDLYKAKLRLLDTININKRIFSLFNAETINFRIKVERNSTLDVNILSRGGVWGFDKQPLKWNF